MRNQDFYVLSTTYPREKRINLRQRSDRVIKVFNTNRGFEPGSSRWRVGALSLSYVYCHIKVLKKSYECLDIVGASRVTQVDTKQDALEKLGLR